MLILPAKPNRFEMNTAMPNGGSMAVSVADGSSASDAFVSAMDMRPAFSDTITATDSTSKTHGITTSDTVVAVDWLKVKRERSETDFTGV